MAAINNGVQCSSYEEYKHDEHINNKNIGLIKIK